MKLKDFDPENNFGEFQLLSVNNTFHNDGTELDADGNEWQKRVYGDEVTITLKRPDTK